MYKGKYDFCGWASKNDLQCSDGRIIRKGAFGNQDGCRVPLVWNHSHNSPEDTLGHAILENREEGVYVYGVFNGTPKAQHAKECVKHGDVTALSIWANNLKQNGPEVLHGAIREVSLVLAGANPGAFIESVLAHGEPMDPFDEEGIFYTPESISFAHAEEETKEEKKEEKEDKSGDETISDIYETLTDKQKDAVAYIVGAALGGESDDEEGEEISHADGSDEDGETVADVYKTLTDKQKEAVAVIVGTALQDVQSDEDEEEEEDDMKHNIFDNDEREDSVHVLSHSDMKEIIENGRRCGSFKTALQEFIDSCDGQIMAHAMPTTGMTTSTGNQQYGFNDPDMLFPDFKSLNTPPEWLSRNMDWVTKVLGGVHRTPFSRIKSVYADITEDEARARGYIKGKQKKEEVFTTLKRTTEPQTVYKKQKLDRDDIIDITDFDVIAWIRAEMRLMLNEEIARAILIGDGRSSDSDDKIKEDRIRPIAKDVPLFNTIVKVKVAPGATADEIAKATINAVIKARKNYKGSGSPSFWTYEDVTTDMLLMEDAIGHKLYKTEAELATALRVREIIPVEPMEGQEIQIESQKYKLLGVIVNMMDYNVGTDRGGEITMFDDFDIDYNQQKYLIETRMSGALVKPFSAMTVVLDDKNP